MNGEVCIEYSILISHEHKCRQLFRLEVQWRILHKCHYLLTLVVSSQGKCIYGHYRNVKGDHDLR